MNLQFRLDDDTDVFIKSYDGSISIMLNRYDSDKCKDDRIVLNFQNEKAVFDFFHRIVGFLNLSQDDFYFLVSRYKK